MEKVEVGQVVWLNSGGNPLTVSATETHPNNSGWIPPKGKCQCECFSGGKLETFTLNLPCLSATNPYPDVTVSGYSTPIDLLPADRPINL